MIDQWTAFKTWHLHYPQCDITTDIIGGNYSLHAASSGAIKQLCAAFFCFLFFVTTYALALPKIHKHTYTY